MSWVVDDVKHKKKKRKRKKKNDRGKQQQLIEGARKAHYFSGRERCVGAVFCETNVRRRMLFFCVSDAQTTFLFFQLQKQKYN
jgi:hypothetical protein